MEGERRVLKNEKIVYLKHKGIKSELIKVSHAPTTKYVNRRYKFPGVDFRVRPLPDYEEAALNAFLRSLAFIM